MVMKMATKEKARTQRPFGILDKIGYMFGDFGNDFTFTLASMFMMKFYTEVMDVSPAIVGALMVVARLVDAVTDVTMGQLVDRSPTRKGGKFRPWMRTFAGAVAVSSFLMYANWLAGAPSAVKVVWMFVTYLLWCSVCYTGFVVPYGSLAGAITDNPDERAQLSVWRSIGGTLAMLSTGVIIPLVAYSKDAAGNTIFTGSRMMFGAGICSVLALVCYALCYSLTTERVKLPQKTEKFDIGAYLNALLHNKCLLIIVLVLILKEVANTGLQGMASFIYPEYFNNGDAQAISNVVGTVVSLLVATVTGWFASKFGKKELTVAGCLLCSATLLVAFFVHTHQVYVWIAFYAVITLGLSAFAHVSWAFATDIVDENEIRTGKREDGNIYGLYSLGRKVGQAINSGVNGAMLAAIGYNAQTKADPAVLDKVYDVTCIVPMVGFALMAAVVAFLYPLNKKRVLENAAILSARRGETK